MSEKKPVSAAQKAATKRFEDKRYDKILLRLQKDSITSKESIQTHAEKAGESLNGYITKAIEARIKAQDNNETVPALNAETEQQEPYRTPKPKVKKEMSTEQLLELTQRLKEEKSEKCAEKMQTIQEVIFDTAEQEENNAN